MKDTTLELWKKPTTYYVYILYSEDSYENTQLKGDQALLEERAKNEKNDFKTSKVYYL